MSTILVVDDMPIFRDPIGASLRLAGYNTVCAVNGREALLAAKAHRPDAILLDVAMPVMDGITCLRGLRADPELAKVPVILLTAMSDKRYVVEAGKLGVHDYLLKSAFSMQELLTRLGRYVAPPAKPGTKSDGAAADGTSKAPMGKAVPVAPAAPAAGRVTEVPSGRATAAATSPAAPSDAAPVSGGPKAVVPPPEVTAPEAPESTAPVLTNPALPPASPVAPAPVTESRGGAGTDEPGSIRRILTREQCLARAEKALGAKTLSGAVADVIRLAASPRSNVGDIAPLIARDPMLSARVLQAANSAAYTSSRGVVSNIHDAVRQVGTSTVRQIAAAMGIFDAMPPSEADGFNPVRCWQHSFAVAMLCERLASHQKETSKEGGGQSAAGAGAGAGAIAPGIAYLVGLCHDLGEILFHTHFSKEFAQVAEARAHTGKPADDVERQMLGLTRGELVQTIIKSLGLPDAIKEPIGAFHGTSSAGSSASTLLRILKAAELYANGLMLASGARSLVAPLTKAECRAAIGRDDPPAPDATVFRSEVLYTTGVLARLSTEDAEAVMKPVFERTKARLWVTREGSLSGLDPVSTALESLGHVSVRDRLPQVGDLDEFDGVVVLAPSDLTPGFTAPELAKALGAAARPLPVLWLVARATFTSPHAAPKGRPAPPAPARWPVSLEKLAAFVNGCVGDAAADVTAAAA